MGQAGCNRQDGEVYLCMGSGDCEVEGCHREVGVCMWGKKVLVEGQGVKWGSLAVGVRGVWWVMLGLGEYGGGKL